MWRDSMKFIEPGTGAGKDDYWKGPDTQEQAKRHIAEFETRFDPKTHTCVDIYDNSSGHDCKAVDALNVAAMNILPGGKNYYIMRDGFYYINSEIIQQSMHFKIGDILRVPVHIGSALSISTKSWKAVKPHLPGEEIGYDSELLGTAKGIRQVLLEREVPYEGGICRRAAHMKETNNARKQALEDWKADKNNYELLLTLLNIPTYAEDAEVSRGIVCRCQSCVLAAQPDFANQVSGLEEIYEDHNKANGTNHFCLFLPKFHPELNPIERAWSRMKWYVRKHNTGKIVDLRDAMTTGLSDHILPVAMIRRFCRLTTAYIEAYSMGHDIMQAETWLSSRRSHRGYATTMDSKLELLYYPQGRIQKDETSIPTEDIGQDELENLIEALHPC